MTFELEVGEKTSGLIVLSATRKKKKWQYLMFHFFPLKDIQWGYKEDWYDGPHHSFGLGPLLLICWSW